MAQGELFDELREAAIEAEYASGEHEQSEAEARSHVLVRVARMTVGVLVTILGVILMPLPGPGGVVVALGLTILARDVAWADRLLRYVRRKMPGVPEEGAIPRSTIITGVFLMAAGLIFAWWWSTRGG